MALNKDELGQLMFEYTGTEADIDSQEGLDSPAKSKAKKKALKKYTALADAIIEHIISKIEIKGIKGKLDSPTTNSTVTIPVTAGVGATSPGVATGQVSSPSTSQTNDGTGLVK